VISTCRGFRPSRGLPGQVLNAQGCASRFGRVLFESPIRFKAARSAPSGNRAWSRVSRFWACQVTVPAASVSRSQNDADARRPRRSCSKAAAAAPVGQRGNRTGLLMGARRAVATRRRAGRLCGTSGQWRPREGHAAGVRVRRLSCSAFAPSSCSAGVSQPKRLLRISSFRGGVFVVGGCGHQRRSKPQRSHGRAHMHRPGPLLLLPQSLGEGQSTAGQSEEGLMLE